MTLFVHGKEQADKCMASSRGESNTAIHILVFKNNTLDTLSQACASKTEVRNLIKNKGIKVNDTLIEINTNLNHNDIIKIGKNKIYKIEKSI